MKRNAPRSVVIVTSLQMISGQHQLAGILDFCLNNGTWLLTVVNSEDFTVRGLQHFLDRRADGFIIHLPGSNDAMDLLLRSDVPTVLVNIGGYRLPKGRRNVSYFWTDNLEIGRLGAEHFLSKKGYRFFAFVSSESHEKTPDSYWSPERKRGFCERMKQERIPCQTHFSNGRMDNWLREIPKPAALMASYDEIAIRLVADCRRLGISVPNEVSVLGVDDIATSEPSISSVNIDFRRAGQMEASELDKLMKKPNRSGIIELMIPSKGVIGRKTTALPQHADLAIQALRYIAANACSGIAVSDVVAHLGCSRRLAELRFRQGTGRSIRSEIERVRIARAQTLLKTPSATLKAVAKKCGYTSADILSRALSRTAKKQSQVKIAGSSNGMS